MHCSAIMSVSQVATRCSNIRYVCVYVAVGRVVFVDGRAQYSVANRRQIASRTTRNQFCRVVKDVRQR